MYNRSSIQERNTRTLACVSQVPGVVLEALSKSCHHVYASTPQMKKFLYFMHEETRFKVTWSSQDTGALKDSKCLQSFEGSGGGQIDLVAATT